MKKITLSLSALLFTCSIAVKAQQRQASQAISPTTNAPSIQGPIKNDPPVILPGQGVPPQKQQPVAFSNADANKMVEDQKNVNMEIEKRIESEHSKGIITLNFGIVKQGEQQKIFCPFNINTLESQESTRTPTLENGFLQKYSLWNKPSAISSVSVGFGPLMSQYKGAATGGEGNGFFVTYSPTTQLGAADEMVTFFTKNGNITYRLIGYVYAKDGETTVSK